MGSIIVLATVLLAGLQVAGSGRLITPPFESWDGAAAWYERVGPDTAVIVGLRLLAMGGAAWLLLGAALQLCASLSFRAGVQRVADALSPLALRRLAHGAASLSVGVGLAAPAEGSPFADDPPGTAVMEVLEDGEDSVGARPTTTLAPSPRTPAPPLPAPVLADEVTIEPGDSFWTVAAEVVANAPGLEPTDQAVYRYWQHLIEANRQVLVDPANPDLLFPGQILTLPPASDAA